MHWMSLVGALFGRKRYSPPRRNAPVDPFGDSDRSAAGLTRTFRILRASYLLETSGPFLSFGELRLDHPGAWFDSADPPKAVLFISHRWKTAQHPDPHGLQAEAIRVLLRNMIQVAHASANKEERSRLVPSLLRHGILQAAYILNTAMTFGENSEGGWRQLVEKTKSVKGDFGSLAGEVASGFGIWYDYACLPQDSSRSGFKGTDADSRLLLANLRQLHSLISQCTLVSLRAAGDDYVERSWCMLELATEPDIARRGCEQVVLRTDLLGKPIHEADIGVGRPMDTAQKFREVRLANILDWVKTGGPSLEWVDRLYQLLDELEDDRPVPLFTSARPPVIFPGQRALMGYMIDELDRLSRSDRSLWRRLKGQRLQGDIEESVRGALRAANLKCTDPADLIYTGLMILYARHRGATELASFYGACLKRWLDGKPLRLLRYRERRSLSENRASWIFEDDSVASVARNQ